MTVKVKSCVAQSDRNSHKDAVGSLQEFTAGGVDEDAVLFTEGSSRGQTVLSPRMPIPSLSERDSKNMDIKHTSHISNSLTAKKLNNLNEISNV